VLIALGAGIIAGAILMNGAQMSAIQFKVEEKARAMGMDYPDEILVITNGEGN